MKKVGGNKTEQTPACNFAIVIENAGGNSCGLGHILSHPLIWSVDTEFHFQNKKQNKTKSSVLAILFLQAQLSIRHTILGQKDFHSKKGEASTKYGNQVANWFQAEINIFT
jgi:hypothetical protein